MNILIFLDNKTINDSLLQIYIQLYLIILIIMKFSTLVIDYYSQFLLNFHIIEFFFLK